MSQNPRIILAEDETIGELITWCRFSTEDGHDLARHLAYKVECTAIGRK